MSRERRYITIGRAIRAERLARKWTQRDLARWARVGLRSISRVEAGADTTLGTVSAIGGVLGLSLLLAKASNR